MLSRDNRTTAIHEAGHIVMAQLVGSSVRKASLKVNQTIKSNGYVVYRYSEEYDDFDMERHIMLDLAGKAAEKACINSNIFWVHDGDAKSALVWLVLCYRDTEYYPKAKHEELNFFRGKLKQRRELCFKTLKARRHQKAIRAFAEALSAKRTLNSVEIKRITQKLGLLHSPERHLLLRRLYEMSTS